MIDLTIAHRQSAGFRFRGLRSGFFAFVDRLRRRLADWRELVRSVRAEAELRRKLEGVDDHLLRDIGLRRVGHRLETVNGLRNLSGRRDV
jgi:hypothetical protein